MSAHDPLNARPSLFSDGRLEAARERIVNGSVVSCNYASLCRHVTEVDAGALIAALDEALALLKEAYPGDFDHPNRWRYRVEQLGAWPLKEDVDVHHVPRKRCV